MATWVRILDSAVWIWQSSNTNGKGMNPTILSSAMVKQGDQTGLFNFGMSTNLGEGKL